MKTSMKALTLVLCAVLLVCASVMGTLAYLKAETEVVKNTFTVGKVEIDLDEAKVDEYGVEVEGASRVKANEYKLIPGHTYAKDPMITVKTGSEDCWVFAKLEDGLADASTIVINEGWTQIRTTDGSVVYAYNTKLSAGMTATLFNEFTFGDYDPAIYEQAAINITGYAVQADGFGTAQAAWDATFGA